MIKTTMKRVTAGAALGGAMFFAAGLGIANAQPGDGQVDLLLGTAGVLDNVPLGAASQIAAGVCVGDVAQVTWVAEYVVTCGAQQIVCNTTIGAVEFRQNAGTAPAAEEPTAEAPAEEPTSEAPAEEPTSEAPAEEPTAEEPTAGAAEEGAAEQTQPAAPAEVGAAEQGS